METRLPARDDLLAAAALVAALLLAAWLFVTQA